MKSQFEVKNLHVTFQTRLQKLKAVRGVNFYLDENETLGIVGESGSGKSSIAKALLRLLPPSTQISGTIWYEGHDIASYTEKQMQTIRGNGIGMIFQNPATAFNPTMPIGKQMIEGYLKHSIKASRLEAEAAVCQMLTRLDFADPKEVLKSFPHTLSGGMRQRAFIVMALICQPKILLADEPTSALDAHNQKLVLELFKEHQKKTGMKILLITHDMQLAAQLCDRIMVMYGGKIIETASSDKILQNPQHPYTKALLNATLKDNQTKGENLNPIEGLAPNLALSLNYCTFCSRCPDSMNICSREDPPLFPLGPSHSSACFKHDVRYTKGK